MDGSSVNAQNVQNSETAHNYIVKKAFLKMSVMLPHKLEGVTFLHSTNPQQSISSYFPTVLWVGVYWGSREGRDTRKYTQRGAKKVVYGINQNIFVIVVLSIRSTVPSIVSSRKQKEKKTSKRDFFLKQEILVKERYQNIFTMLIG